MRRHMGANAGIPNVQALAPVVLYVEPLALAKQLAYRDTTDANLQTVCEAATEAIDDWCGNTAQFDPVPATIKRVALSLAVDIWKQPDATFGIMGLSETGPVRVARDLVMRYDASLIPFYNGINGWGIA
ncbi:MAG: hypothetical protein ABW007_02875 [Chitinophagaceae bacterium]